MSRTRTRKPLTDDERAEQRAAERALVQAAVEQLRSSEGWTAWLQVRRRFHAYSLRNQLLIALQCPHATRVAGFRAWLALGYCVRRGEKALRIFAPCPPSKAKLEAWRKAGADPTDKPRTFFRLAAVFDRSQVDELPPPAVPTPLDPPVVDVAGDDFAHALAPLIELADEIGSSVTFEPVPGTAHGYYTLDTKAIVVDDSLTANQQVKTLVHELAHALLRDQPDDDQPTLTYAEEELVVETTAYLACASIGLDTSGYSIGYLASWSHDTPIATIEHTATLIDRLTSRLEDALTGTAAITSLPA